MKKLLKKSDRITLRIPPEVLNHLKRQKKNCSRYMVSLLIKDYLKSKQGKNQIRKWKKEAIGILYAEIKAAYKY